MSRTGLLRLMHGGDPVPGCLAGPTVAGPGCGQSAERPVRATTGGGGLMQAAGAPVEKLAWSPGRDPAGGELPERGCHGRPSTEETGRGASMEEGVPDHLLELRTQEGISVCHGSRYLRRPAAMEEQGTSASAMGEPDWKNLGAMEERTQGRRGLGVPWPRAGQSRGRWSLCRAPDWGERRAPAGGRRRLWEITSRALGM